MEQKTQSNLCCSVRFAFVFVALYCFRAVSISLFPFSGPGKRSCLNDFRIRGAAAGGQFALRICRRPGHVTVGVLLLLLWLLLLLLSLLSFLHLVTFK